MDIDDAQLDGLIRRSRLARLAQPLSLDPGVVHAYLTGAATAEQKTEVRRALAESAEFRSELLALADHLETLSSRTATEAFDASVEAEIETESKVDFLERLRSWVESLIPAPRWSMVGVPVAAALAVAFVLLPMLRRDGPMLAIQQTVFVDLQEVLSVPGSPRGEPTSHTDAVFSRLQDCVREGGSGVELQLPEAPTEIAFPVSLEAHVKSENGDTIRTFRFVGKADGPVEDTLAWLVTLRNDQGSVELRSHEVTRHDFSLQWSGPEAGVFIMTTATPQGFLASPCLPVSPRKLN